MRVLWLAHRDIEHPRAGGAERSVFEIGRRLVRRAHQVTTLGLSWPGSDGISTLDGVRVVRAPSVAQLHLVAQHLIAGPPGWDVVVEDLGHVLPWISNLFGNTPRVAFFRHLHARTLAGQVGILPAAVLRAVERAYPLVFRSVEFVTESRSSESDLVSLGVPASRIARVPPGVDREIIKPQPKTREPSFVYFGGLKPYKRPAHALAAFDELLKELPDASLTVVGNGPELPALVREIRTRSLEKRVHLVGRLAQRDLDALLGSAWVNVHCAVAEGWCYSVTEAAASGVPTVAYSVPGVTDSVRNYSTGILVPDGDLNALARAMLEVAVGRAEYEARCIASLSGASWESTADGWEMLLAAAASTGRGLDTKR